MIIKKQQQQSASPSVHRRPKLGYICERMLKINSSSREKVLERRCLFNIQICYLNSLINFVYK